ncbi:MAG: cellulase family glycosylhydrolase [bacterium]
MKNCLQLFVVLLSMIMLTVLTSAQEKSKRWYEEGRWEWPKPDPNVKTLPLISVKGNKFVNASGDTILFKGIAISDPDKLEGQGHWSKLHFEKVKEMGATLVRIPIHPIAWRERTPDVYLKLLDQAVTWCSELGMYVILDWHSIGNLVMELFQNPMYNTSQTETFEFWRTIAAHFRGHNTVAFYEIFNEPTNFNGMLGTMAWSEWQEMNEKIINLIRAYDKEKIPIVSGFDWAYDLGPLHSAPINADGIAYATHPYSNKRSEPWEPKWEENFGFAANRFPVIATEFGFNLKDDEVIDDNHYANRITRFLERKGISWVCWVFEPDWHPQMLKSWNYDLTGCGEFFKMALHREIAK